MRFGILGAVEAVEPGGGPVELGAAQHRALLARLLLSPNRVVPVESLLEALWDEPEQAHVRSLRVYVSRLRKILGEPSPLVTRPPGYVLLVYEDDVDAARSDALARDGRRLLAEGSPQAAAETLREALALWRGPALADVADRDFARAAAVRLTEARLGVLEDRIDAELACGHHGPLAAELRQLTADHPERERLWCQRMLAEYRAGQPAQALRTFQELRAALADELGLDPGVEARKLERAILDQDPTLDWRPPAGATRATTEAPTVAAEAVRVMLVDDHPLWRAAVRGMLERDPGFAVVAEAEDGPSAIEVATAHRPDVVLMDLHLPGFTGAEAAGRIIEVAPETRVLMLSASGDEGDVFDAVRGGAVGYVLKSGSPEEIVESVRKVGRGETVFTPSLASLVLDHLRRGETGAAGPMLSTRQRDVLRMVADGNSLAEASVRLGLDEDSVRHEVGVVVERLHGVARAGHIGRFVRTVLFADVVGSTERAAQLGDRAWTDVLVQWQAAVRDTVDARGGRLVRHIGDGSFATFEQPGPALDCGSALVGAAASHDLAVRVGVHTGECEVATDDVNGMAVHLAARVEELAQPGEVLATHTVHDLVLGSEHRFESRGLHGLRGVPGKWRLYSLSR